MRVFDRNIAAAGAFLTALTIAIGAFGAHGLKQIIDGPALATFEVGVRYQMYHAIALVILAFAPFITEKTKRLVFWFWIVGILFFSGSIYLLSLKDYLGLDMGKFAIITPVGGFFYILGWLRLAYGLFRLKKQ